MIPELILNSCYCVLSERKHILEKPLCLPCGHHACAECIGAQKLVKCIQCDTQIIIEVEKCKEVEFVKNTISSFIQDLFVLIEDKFKSFLPQFQGKFINQKKLIFQKFSSIMFSRQYFIIK